MNIELTHNEIAALAAWMEDNVAVHLAPGVDQPEDDHGVLDPNLVRSLTPNAVRRLTEDDAQMLASIIQTWVNWRDRDTPPEEPVYEVTIGSSPWREERRETPPMVPLGRDDLVWMEWISSGAQFHQAHPDEPVPALGGAGEAVLTTRARATDLGVYACPDCFPDDVDSPYVSVTDTKTGLRTTVNTNELGGVPTELFDVVNTATDDPSESKEGF